MAGPTTSRPATPAASASSSRRSTSARCAPSSSASTASAASPRSRASRTRCSSCSRPRATSTFAASSSAPPSRTSGPSSSSTAAKPRSRRSFGAYFKSPVAYVVIGAFAPIVGYLFFSSFFAVGNTSMESFFGNMPFLLLFFCPAIAMRLVSEEKGSGTIEMLLTMPVRESEVAVGKYLAALGVLAVGLVVTLPFAITVGRLGPLDVGPVIGGYVGTLLLGGTYLAIGLFASALTKNQVVAFIVGLAIC